MAGKKGENTKKVAGNARKADAAAAKKAAAEAKLANEENKKWTKGAKDNSKKEEAEAKKVEAARKKAERDALLAAEEASQPLKPKGAGAKTAQKKATASTGRGTLDLNQLDEPEATSQRPVNKSDASAPLRASGIDNALDALSLVGEDRSKVERHPERRFRAAYSAFEARRLPEIEIEYPGLRRKQRVDLCRKEFEKSEENPFNQAYVAFDATFDEVQAAKGMARKELEARLIEEDAQAMREVEKREAESGLPEY